MPEYRSWLWLDTATRAHSQVGFAQCHPGHWASTSKLQLRLSKLCLLPRSPEPVVTNGPQQPVAMALLATIFLLREVEVSTAVAAAWKFDHVSIKSLGTCLVPNQITWH